MAIVVVGFNHKTAPVAIRERIYFALDKLALYLQDLLATGYTKEAVLLSTCNRSELYCETDDYSKIYQWFSNQTSLQETTNLKNFLYHYKDEDAVKHMMAVAAGLDSMVIGEPQILGQMKEAYSESCAVSAVGPAFHRLFQHIFTIAKEIRTSTAIGACPVSMVSAAAHFAQSRVKAFKDSSVVIIGAGDTARLLIRYLTQVLQKPLTLINRTPKKAQLLMQAAHHSEMGGMVYGMDALPWQLNRADVVFSMTGSALPIINQTMLMKAMHGRESRSLFLIDIAVPRDIDPEVLNLPNVELYCIDDLKTIIEANRTSREHAAEKAYELINKESAKVLAEYRSFDKVAYTIRAYRKQIEDICGQELDKARSDLLKGSDPALVLEAFAHAYTNKLLHIPSVQLRQAGVEGRFELLRYAKQLFAIPDWENDSYEAIYRK